MFVSVGIGVPFIPSLFLPWLFIWVVGGIYLQKRMAKSKGDGASDGMLLDVDDGSDGD